jgi:hypothetical protein
MNLQVHVAESPFRAINIVREPLHHPHLAKFHEPATVPMMPSVITKVIESFQGTDRRASNVWQAQLA